MLRDQVKNMFLQLFLFFSFYISTPDFTNPNLFQTQLSSSALQEGSRLYLKKKSSDQTALPSLQVPSCKSAQINTFFKSSCLQAQSHISVVITSDAEVAQQPPPFCAPCVCVCAGETVLSNLRALLTQSTRESVRRRACVSLYVPGVCRCGSRGGCSHSWLPARRAQSRGRKEEKREGEAGGRTERTGREQR